VAARATENPALDVALALGRRLGKPVFVYHALSERYRYASDRLHTFILEGARELQRDVKARGVGAVFHLERAGERGRVLLQLARDAAAVVADFMPVQPLLKWDASVAQVAPLWRVDASCLAPLWRFTEAHTRAFTFRQAATPVWKAALEQPWVDEPTPGPPFLPALPFTPVDLEQADLAALVASCDIDHAVARVHHTPGGATAGLARWVRFRQSALDQYARDRNEPTLDGVSRLSAYLHLGHVSPFRLAREAAAHRTKGADTWLDELLTWRELGWHFCWHHPRHDTVEALPGWARETIKAHERDRRPALPSWDELARAQTGDALWDAAQRSLLTNGELHNSVRMTWGKALLQWTRSASEALALLIDLNHRYALDGRDPASYSGILWCLGALDRPFSPEVSILGSVRPRTTTEHAKRFDVAEYERHTRRAPRGQPLVVAVVGAGVAGAAAARTLQDAGHQVTLFDKGRAAGGRLSTRREGELTFNHGAQYFSVKDERFARAARAFWQERAITAWQPRLEAVGTRPSSTSEAEPASPPSQAAEPTRPLVRLVATPGMSALVERLHRGLDVRLGVEVNQLARRAEQWRLLDAAGHALGEYDAVVVATPGPQAATLLDPASYALASRAREAVMAPCWAVMVAFERRVDLEPDALFINTGPLRWAARETSRPGTGGPERWVLHATAAWSRAHLDETKEAIAPQLLAAFTSLTGSPLPATTHLVAHRWRYAFVEQPLGDDCLFDATLRLAACGDWCLGPRIEDAWLSGVAAAGRLNALDGTLTELPPPRTRPSQMRLV
jgi:hypothetical protein